MKKELKKKTRIGFVRLATLSTLFVVVAMPNVAFAATTMGDALTNIANAFGDFHNLHTTFAYVAGIFMAVWALFKFKDHVDAPNQVPLSDGVKRLIAGGMFLALPMMWEAVSITMIGGGGNEQVSGGFTGGAVAATPTSLDEVAVKLISDIHKPLQAVISVFAWLSGLTFLLIAISRLTRTMQEGARGPAGIGTIVTFLVSGALFNIGNMAGFFTASLFGDKTSSMMWVAQGDLKTALGGAQEIIVARTVEAVMVFVALVGYIAFVRGFFVLKAVADGSQQVSIAQALTFLFGGALAINLGDLINALQDSMGYAALGFTFS